MKPIETTTRTLIAGVDQAEPIWPAIHTSSAAIRWCGRHLNTPFGRRRALTIIGIVMRQSTAEINASIERTRAVQAEMVESLARLRERYGLQG